MDGVKRYQDIACWQLAAELEKLVYELTDTWPVARDLKFRDEIRDSSSSATRNIAEGFGSKTYFSSVSQLSGAGPMLSAIRFTTSGAVEPA